MLQVGTMRVTFTVLQAFNQKAPQRHFGTPGIKSWGFLFFRALLVDILH